MLWGQFFKLLEKGSQTSIDYWPSKEEAVEEDELKYYFIEYLTKFKSGEFTLLRQKSLTEIMELVCEGVTPTELQQAVAEMNYGSIIPLVQKYLPEAYLQERHGGGLMRKFGPYLSVSVGGPILLPTDNLVTVEMVLPDEVVEINPTSLVGEKEVLIRKLPLDAVTRAYTANQMYTEIVENPNSNVGAYNNEHPVEVGSGTNALEEWRWHAPTEDYFPVSLVRL